MALINKHWNNATNDFYTFLLFGIAKEKGRNRKYYEESLSVEYPYHGRWRKLTGGYDIPYLRRIYIRTKIKGYLE